MATWRTTLHQKCTRPANLAGLLRQTPSATGASPVLRVRRDCGRMPSGRPSARDVGLASIALQQGRAPAFSVRRARIRTRRGPQAARHALRIPIRCLEAPRASATPATLATASRAARRVPSIPLHQLGALCASATRATSATASRAARRVRQGRSTRVVAKTGTLAGYMTEFARICSQVHSSIVRKDRVLDCQWPTAVPWLLQN